MPFNGDPAAAQPGYVVELLREVFSEAGVEVDYQIMPWSEAVSAAERGEIDAVIGANEKEAARLLTGNVPIAEPKFALFTNKDSTWNYANARSLQEVQLGVIAGYSYWASLDGYVAKAAPNTLKVYSSNEPLREAMADLVAGRIDALPESVLVFHWAARAAGKKFTDFRMVYSEAAAPLYVAFAKNDTGRKFARMFDEGLRRLQANGRFQAILDSYGFAKNK
jgi:polar amino acid transport system substrate-binding protein